MMLESKFLPGFCVCGATDKNKQRFSQMTMTVSRIFKKPCSIDIPITNYVWTHVWEQDLMHSGEVCTKDTTKSEMAF